MTTHFDGDRSQFTQTLRRGDSGEAVSQLQDLLNRNGSHVPVDGTFAASTLTALISFQQKKGLHVNGQVDSETWQALRQ